MALMEPVTPDYTRLRQALTERLNAHDLADVMDYGAPGNEYNPEMEDFAALVTRGEPVTPEVVAAVWHKWFGDSQGNSAGEPERPTAAMPALAADLQDVQHSFVQY
jgi:hypothetical protein